MARSPKSPIRKQKKTYRKRGAKVRYIYRKRGVKVPNIKVDIILLVILATGVLLFPILLLR